MKTLLSSILTVLFITGISITSCKNEKAVEPSDCTKTYSFQNDVFPILQTNCLFAGCHADASNSGFTMNSYTEFVYAVDVKGVLAAIKHEGPNPMPRINPAQPQANKLADSLITTIECWIEQGKQNN